MVGILFAITASLIFAFAYTAIKRSYADFPSSVAFFIDVLLGLCIYIPFGLILGASFHEFGTVMLYAFANAILAEAFFFYVLSKGEISITGTILASYPIYTVLFSVFINDEHFPLFVWLIIVCIVAGIILVSLPKQNTEGKEVHKFGYILWALAGAFAIGFDDSLNKHIIA